MSKAFNILNWASAIIIIFVAIYIIVIIKSESNAWMKDPLKYCMKGLDKANNDNITCICSGTRPTVTSVIITSQGIKPFRSQLETSGEQVSDNWIYNINFTK